MTELLALDLVRKGVVTRKLTLTIGYDITSLSIAKRGKTPKENVYIVVKTGLIFKGEVKKDPYGRPVPKHAHGTGNIDHWTSSTKLIVDCMMNLYDRIIDPDLMIRRVTICACDIISENAIPEEESVQLDFFTDYSALEKQKAAERAKEEKERALQKATLMLQSKYGKNAVLKGMNLMQGAMTIERNGQIGGHSAGGEQK